MVNTIFKMFFTPTKVKENKLVTIVKNRKVKKIELLKRCAPKVEKKPLAHKQTKLYNKFFSKNFGLNVEERERYA